MRAMTRHMIPRVYYLVTPAFVALDYFAGVNVRVAVLDAMPVYKYPYYGVCMIFGVIVFFAPKASPFVALFESLINILITALAIVLPYLENLAQVGAINGNWKAAETFGVEGIINIIIVGTMGTVAFRLSLDEIARISGFKDAGSHPRLNPNARLGRGDDTMHGRDDDGC